MGSRSFPQVKATLSEVPQIIFGVEYVIHTHASTHIKRDHSSLSKHE
jgi:hypothetical protein